MENTYMSIILSSRFKDILCKIDDNISRFILSLENNQDYTYSFSFLDIADDESTISFLNTNKYQELPRERGNGDLAWSCSSRNEIRCGRLINKIAPFYKPFEIEKWVNSFKAEYKNALKNIKFKVIEGNDIVKFYNGKRYARGNGSLNKSCMRHDVCADWMDIYIKNSDKIKMLILLEGNKDVICGRAILWKLDSPKDTWLLDRIYVKEDSDAILFKKYAEKNNWLYKPLQTYDCVKVVKDGEEVFINMKVSIKGNYKFFPYIDTLQYYNKKDNYLTNDDKEYQLIPDIIKLREINGRDSGNENFVYDVLNEVFISIDDAVYCFYGDGYTHKNNAFYIKDFDEYALPSDVRYSSYHKRFLTSQSSVYSHTLNSFVMNSEVQKVFITKDRKCFDYFLRSDFNKTFNRMSNGNFYISNILIKGIDDEYYFKDEYDENAIFNEYDKQKNIMNEIISSSDYVREMMGYKRERRKKSIFGT